MIENQSFFRLAKFLLQVNKSGYENLILPNALKVTASDNFYIIELTPLPQDLFLIRGKIEDFENGNPLDSVEVLLITGTRKESVVTNDWGYYDFKFSNKDIENGQKFTLAFQSKGYESTFEYNGGLFLNNIDIPIVKLKKSKQEIPEIAIIKPDRPHKIPLISIGIAPNANLFLSKGEMQVQGAANFEIRWSLSKKREKFTVGGGWNLPVKITTQNNFETLTGLTSEVKTKYKINTLGYIDFRYSQQSRKMNNGAFFIGIAALFLDQVPDPPTFVQDYHESTINSHRKFAPKFYCGISLQKKLLRFEPYLALSYLKVTSQNFKFNYFGSADLELIHHNFFPISLGLNFSVAILNH